MSHPLGTIELVTDLLEDGSSTHTIVSGDVSGGAHTSRTITLEDFETLLASVPVDADRDQYESAIVDMNVLGKRSTSSRERSFRYLRELYLLDPNQPVFSALRDLWNVDPAGRPLLAMLSALAHDPALRATSSAVLPVAVNEPVTSEDLEKAVQNHFGHSYSHAIANKIGRNAGSSWTQSGHLEGRTNKKRVRALHTPGALAYAFFLGHLTDKRGQGLFTSLWARTLDASSAEMHGLAGAASARGWIDYKRFGDVIEVGFRRLLGGGDSG